MLTKAKVQTISTQLCEALGADTSADNVNKVSSLMAELIKEVTQINTDSYNGVVKRCCNNDGNETLVKRISDEINIQNETLIANLSAMR